MHALTSRTPYLSIRRTLLVLLLFSLTGLVTKAQQKTAPPQGKTVTSSDKPKIRAITAFINLDRAQYTEQVADALKMLRRAQVTFESRGYQVQTIRIATQPFPEYT